MSVDPVTVSVLVYLVLWCVLLGGDLAHYYRQLATARFPLITKMLFQFIFLFMAVPGYYFTEQLLPEVEDGQGDRTQMILHHGLTLALPVLISVVCVAVQVGHLVRKRVGGTRNRRITVTIIQLTVITAICNTLNVALTVWFTDVDAGVTDGAKFITLYLSINCIPFVNSALCPIVLVVRGRELNAYVRRVVRCGRSKVDQGSVNNKHSAPSSR